MIILPICALLYGLWDAKQPKTGPIGNGISTPSFLQLVPIYCAILSGILNLPVAITRYLKFKKTKEQENNKESNQKIDSSIEER